MVPASLAILSHTFPRPVERRYAVSAWANTASLGFAAGPVLGGLLSGLDRLAKHLLVKRSGWYRRHLA